MDIKQMEYDESAGRLLAFFLIINILNMTIKQTITVGIITRYLTPFLGLLYMLKLFLERKYVKFVYARLMGLEMFFMILIVISMIRYPDIVGSILKRSIWILAFCIPLSMVASKVKDYQLFIDQTRTANFITLLCATFSFFFTLIRDGKFNYANYNMPMCYTLLLPMLYHIAKLKENKRYFLFVIMETAIIMLYGSRGQLLCIFIFVCLLTLSKSNASKKVIYIAFSGMVVLFIIVFFQDLLKLIALMAAKTGSRTLGMLARGRLVYDSGRFPIWLKTWERIMEKPFIGWGLAGELNYLVSSPHNLFLEIMLHYGIVIGGLLSVWLFTIVFLRIISGCIKDTSVLIMFCSSFIPLFLSGTYTEAPIFWVLVVICMRKTSYINQYV